MKNKFSNKHIRKFLNESYDMAPQMYRLDYDNIHDIEEEEPHDHYGHPGESDAPPHVEADGTITPEALHQHFDIDGDGQVDMSDYAEHVDYHCEHPEMLEDYMHLKDYRRDDVHCHDSYSKCCDYLMVDKLKAKDAIMQLMDACGSTCSASTASALADVLELLKSKNLL